MNFNVLASMAVGTSNLNKNKSKILERGYINVYTDLNFKERRQLEFNRRYKRIFQAWDNSLIKLCGYFDESLIGRDKARRFKVLDAGCGNGNYLIDEFRDRIDLACGVDLKPEFTSKNVCLDEIRYSSLQKIPYEDETFDFVIMLWVLEHLKNPLAVLKEMSRVLKPGGELIFATPNKNFISLVLKNFLSSKRANFFINKHFYGRFEKEVFETFYLANTLADLKDLFARANFKTEKLELNFDPGYTSFDSLTFYFTILVSSFLRVLGLDSFESHIVGRIKKVSSGI
ncbi:class I SAM-dependent methyltransferase [candidate division WWE3 bacterium]|nr:class I SAM-dependent methyltransferase [candidate division WWE3 bacterium]